MTTFTITTDNNITAFPTPEEAQDLLALGAQSFASQKELAKLAADWPTNRLVEVWNSFAGVAPFDGLKAVKKFTDRATGTNRIWQAIQKLAPAAEQAAQDAPEAAAATTETIPAPDAPKTKKGAKGAKVAKAAKGAKEAKPKREAREGSKKAKVLDMLRREKGATNEEIQKAVGWQPHTVRGFLSLAGSKQGLKIKTIERENGGRAYKL